jgi:two-component system, sensor histidine kinase and response regulator
MTTIAQTSKHDTEKVNILLVDDQPEGLLTLEAILGCLDQNLVTARSGRQALRQVLAHDFAVILLDVQMPEMDGYETATLIRERPANRDTPLIFLTAAHNSEVQTIRGYSLGAVDYLFKPLDADILRSKVSVFIELAKKSAVIRRQNTAIAEREGEARQLAEARALLLADLEQKNRDLAAANEELEAFAYSASHDLRAPLRRIDSFGQALLEDYASRLDDLGVRHLQRIRESAQYMGELIDGLLALTRVTRSELRREDVDLSQLARDIGTRLQNHSASTGSPRQVELRVESGLLAQGDARLLRDVLENLLSNAWKFTSKCQGPRVEVGKSVQGDYPVFFVRDNGAGFDMAYASKLFGAFQRLHPAAEFEGHGIGLATVQRIVHRHGGRIWADGRIDMGATFYFTLGEDLTAGAIDARIAQDGLAGARPQLITQAHRHGAAPPRGEERPRSNRPR